MGSLQDEDGGDLMLAESAVADPVPEDTTDDILNV